MVKVSKLCTSSGLDASITELSVVVVVIDVDDELYMS